MHKFFKYNFYNFLLGLKNIHYVAYFVMKIFNFADRQIFNSLSFLKKLYGPFLRMGFNCLKAIEPLRGGSLLFTIKLPEIPGTHLIDLGRMKG